MGLANIYAQFINQSVRYQSLPHRRKKARYRFRSRLSICRKALSGGMCGGRTHDKRIKSPLLYQLS